MRVTEAVFTQTKFCFKVLTSEQYFSIKVFLIENKVACHNYAKNKFKNIITLLNSKNCVSNKIKLKLEASWENKVFIGFKVK